MGSETQSCRERRNGRTLTTGAFLAHASPRLALFSPLLSVSLPLPLLLPILFFSRYLAVSLSSRSSHPYIPTPFPPSRSTNPISIPSGIFLAAVSFGSSKRASFARCQPVSNYSILLPRPSSFFRSHPFLLLLFLLFLFLLFLFFFSFLSRHSRTSSDERDARQLARESQDPSSKRKLRSPSISLRDDAVDYDDNDDDDAVIDERRRRHGRSEGGSAVRATIPSRN